MKTVKRVCMFCLSALVCFSFVAGVLWFRAWQKSSPSPYGDREAYRDDVVIVGVRAEYREQFDNQAFDFEWENIDQVNYRLWYGEEYGGYLVVRLKEHGKKYVDSAIEHFEALPFVEYAEKDYIVYGDGII